MSVPARKTPPLSNRERLLRIVGAVLDHPAVQEYAGLLKMFMRQAGVDEKLRTMTEENATPIIAKLRELVR